MNRHVCTDNHEPAGWQPLGSTGERSLRRLFAYCITVMAAVATVTTLALPASAVTAHPATTVAATASAPPQAISLGGKSYPTGPLLAAQKYAVMDVTTAEITVLPGAKTALPASTYSELTGLVSALNAADVALRASAAKAPATTASAGASAPLISKIPASPCTRKFHYTWGSALSLYIPDCMAYGFAAAVGGPAAVAAFLFSEIGPLEWAAALVLASAILAAAPVLASWAGFCDIFGPGNGVRFTWTWTHGIGAGPGYPTFGCW